MQTGMYRFRLQPPCFAQGQLDQKIPFLRSSPKLLGAPREDPSAEDSYPGEPWDFHTAAASFTYLITKRRTSVASRMPNGTVLVLPLVSPRVEDQKPSTSTQRFDGHSFSLPFLRVE